MGLFWYHRVSESDGDNSKINGNRCGRKYGIPYQVAEGATVGSLPADSEQFMMIEDIYKTLDRITKHIEDMALNKVNIEFLRKQMDKVLEDIEKLKDSARDMHYKNGNGGIN